MPRIPVALGSAAAIAALALAIPPPAAAIDNATFDVKAVVQADCVFSVSGELDFGTYTLGQTTDIQATTEITYSNCVPGEYQIVIDDGVNGGRVMKNDGGAGELDYQIFEDPGGATPWGSTMSTGKFVEIESTAGGDPIIVHGLLPAAQAGDPHPGNYSDTLTVTIIAQ